MLKKSEILAIGVFCSIEHYGVKIDNVIRKLENKEIMVKLSKA